MLTVLICHEGTPLHQEGIARWLAAESELTGIVFIQEPRKTIWKRVRREFRRSGLLGLLDVLAFRAYYSLIVSGRDRQWSVRALEALKSAYPATPSSVPILRTVSPNSPETEQFITACRPNMMIALCKTILKPNIFSLPTHGTYVFHPGICPEYRNAHGCFWALVNRDTERVGMTLLRIDEGIDTGPVYEYFSYPYDEWRESHFVIQNRVLLENLDPLMAVLQSIYVGEAHPIDTSGRQSAIWGQPRFTKYIRWKVAARRLHATNSS
jgi:methionyl-tRNA formyltransferase